MPPINVATSGTFCKAERTKQSRRNINFGGLCNIHPIEKGGKGGGPQTAVVCSKRGKKERWQFWCPGNPKDKRRRLFAGGERVDWVLIRAKNGLEGKWGLMAVRAFVSLLFGGNDPFCLLPRHVVKSCLPPPSPPLPSNPFYKLVEPTPSQKGRLKNLRNSSPAL